MLINCAETKEELIDFLHKIINYAQTEIQTSVIDDFSDWKYTNHVLSHKSQGFFSVSGLINEHTGAERIVLLQPQSAVTGILYCVINHKIYLLLQARVEPGNIGIGQYGPTVQSTPGNYLKWHGGNSTPYIEYFNAFTGLSNPKFISSQTDIGKRYFQKIKTLIYSEVSEFLTCTHHMIWASLDAIFSAASSSHLLNTDLRSMISVMDWDSIVSKVKVINQSYDGEIMTKYFQSKTKPVHDWKVIPLNKITQWNVSPSGIEPSNNRDVSVLFYTTTCLTREVSSWVQPLMSAPGKGSVIVAYRETENGKEFLLSLISEEGISGQTIIGPTIQVYQEDDLFVKHEMMDGEVVSDFDQSDEGGRFMQHVSNYKLIKVDDDCPVESNQFWVSGAMLKALISTSNLTNIQLRDMCSVILDELNPNYFN